MEIEKNNGISLKLLLYAHCLLWIVIRYRLDWMNDFVILIVWIIMCFLCFIWSFYFHFNYFFQFISCSSSWQHPPKKRSCLSNTYILKTPELKSLDRRNEGLRTFAFWINVKWTYYWPERAQTYTHSIIRFVLFVFLFGFCDFGKCRRN